MTIQPGPLVGEGRTAEVYAWGDGTVLKLFRGDVPRPLAEREAEVTAVAAATSEVAPAFHGAVEVMDRFGIVLERVSGPTLASLAMGRPWGMVRFARLLARIHAVMHRRCVPRLPTQRDLIASAVDRAAVLPEAARRTALAELAAAPHSDALCHGDLHPDNVVIAPRGPVVIDWMTGSCGDPLLDASRTSMLLSSAALLDGTAAWRRAVIGAGRQAFHAVYLREYTRLRGVARADIARWSLVTAAARLGEGIEVEQAALLRRVAAEMRRRETGPPRRR